MYEITTYTTTLRKEDETSSCLLSPQRFNSYEPQFRENWRAMHYYEFSSLVTTTLFQTWICFWGLAEHRSWVSN
jgi:hypothetical protein